MVIECEGLLDPEPVYYYPAGTVRKTPALIVIASEGIPGLLDIVGEDPDEVGNLLGKQISSNSEGTLELAPDFHEGQEFVDDIIGRDQEIGVRLQPSICQGMIRIIGHKGSKPGPGIDEDHASP